MTTVRHESELLTPAEAATELRTSVGTLKRWLRSGQLPGVKLPSGEWRVAEGDLRALRTHAIRDHRRRDAPVTSREPA
jgi:excisionase family DNA binding protein